MHEYFTSEMSKVRRDEYRAEAEKRRFEKLARGERASVRARVARSLFDAAFALEADESWRAVWDRMSGKKHRRRFFEGKKYAG